MITAAQIRGARAQVGWSRADLVAVSMVSRTTIAEIELDKREPYGRTIADIVQALEGDDGSVRLRGDCQ